jgi:translation initiation factor IF-1
MVKNKNGGNRHKKMASKNCKIVSINRKVRKAVDKFELYAKVLQCYGQGRFLVLCNDNIERILIIARKFKGRNKRDNIVAEGGIVLIGRREFEIRDPKKKEHVDLLYVYSPTQHSKLKKDVNFNKEVLLDELVKTEENDCSMIIGNYTESNENKEEVSKKVQAKLSSKKVIEDLDEFDFDDI